MLVRMVSISSPCDPPILACQSDGITYYFQIIMQAVKWKKEAFLFLFVFWDIVWLCHLGWGAVVQSQPTATSASWVQVILLPHSASQVVGITGICQHGRLTFVFLLEMEFHHFNQDSLELLTSEDPSASVSQSAGIIGVSHWARLVNQI